MPWPDLRAFLDRLDAQGDLLRIADPVTWEYEIVALTRQTSDVQGPALLFENVADSRYPVLSGLFAAQRRVALALEVGERELYDTYREREDQPREPLVVDAGPCQEIVLRGDEIDLRELPILLHYEKDGGRYVTAGLQIARHPVTAAQRVHPPYAPPGS